MKVIPVYSVNVWDGGDRTNFAFYLDNTDGRGESAVREWITKHPYDCIREEELVIFSDISDYDEFNSGKVRERALAKLTKAERKALGF